MAPPAARTAARSCCWSVSGPDWVTSTRTATRRQRPLASRDRTAGRPAHPTADASVSTPPCLARNRSNSVPKPLVMRQRSRPAAHPSPSAVYSEPVENRHAAERLWTRIHKCVPNWRFFQPLGPTFRRAAGGGRRGPRAVRALRWGCWRSRPCRRRHEFYGPSSGQVPSRANPAGSGCRWTAGSRERPEPLERSRGCGPRFARPRHVARLRRPSGPRQTHAR
jgi:hypothetical protein